MIGCPSQTKDLNSSWMWPLFVMSILGIVWNWEFRAVLSLSLSGLFVNTLTSLFDTLALVMLKIQHWNSIHMTGNKKKHNRSTFKTRRSSQCTYHLLTRRQYLLYHHAVPCERAPVQHVGPIRTEGTKAWCGCRSRLPRQQSQWWKGEVRKRRRWWW